jgi:hypothetical protein
MVHYGGGVEIFQSLEKGALGYTRDGTTKVHVEAQHLCD